MENVEAFADFGVLFYNSRLLNLDKELGMSKVFHETWVMWIWRFVHCKKTAYGLSETSIEIRLRSAVSVLSPCYVELIESALSIRLLC